MSNSTILLSALAGMKVSSSTATILDSPNALKTLWVKGKPLTLAEMKTLAHHINSHHWEHLRKKSRAGKNKSNNNDNKPDNKGNKSDDKKNQASGSNKSNNSNKNNKFDKNKKPNKSQSSSRNSASIADKLGKDGKLTPQERQCCFDNNLCMFCGGPGHSTKNCPKSSSSASKAKA